MLGRAAAPAALLLLAYIGSAAAAEPALAPGWSPLAFRAPAPGTYELPPLGIAGDGEVLDSNARPRRLSELLGDKIVVLSFVYRSCPDVNGCPLANHALRGVQDRILRDEKLRSEVRLVSLSFDPEHDTPAMMRAHGETLAAEGSDWQFLTTASQAQLAPILAQYGQTVRRERDADGQPGASIAHVLRVFLIDRQKRIRNIYSSSFLHAETLTSDLRTLVLEGSKADTAMHRAGSPQAQRNESSREDKAAMLGLPPLPVPADNPLTAEKIDLGRKLFFDRRLSRNQTISCGMCHVPEQGFTGNESATPVGIEGRSVKRNAPTILNVAYAELLFHDGRETSLERQVWEPLLKESEMGAASSDDVVARIRAMPDYRGLFEAAFDGAGPSRDTVGKALASYERTLVAADSPFDRWRYGGASEAVPAAAKRGFDLFTGKAGCAHCHRVGEREALFTDGALHDTGIGYRQASAPPPARQRVQLAPGVFVDVDPTVLAAASEKPQTDLGRFEITADPADRWRYATPSLRNVALTAPYMHDGSLATLVEVVDFYDGGGVPHDLLDPAMKPLGLSRGDKEDLLAFLASLTGSNVDALVAAALAAPIGEPEGP